MRSVWLIIQREVLVRVRRRTFLLATILAPVLFALMLMLPAILMRIDSGLHAHVALVDETGGLRGPWPCYATRCMTGCSLWGLMPLLTPRPSPTMR